MATQYYVAQINGFTEMGTVAEIQVWWDRIKVEFDFVGKTLYFYRARKTGTDDDCCFVISDARKPAMKLLVK